MAIFGGLGDLYRLRDARRGRTSSWDRSGGNADFWLILPKAVYPAFTLLMTGGIPGQIIMEHGIEMLLKVYALRQAIGADQHILTWFGNQILDPRFALGRRQQACHRFDLHFGRQRLTKVLGHINGGIHEPAKGDGGKAVLEQPFDLLDGSL